MKIRYAEEIDYRDYEKQIQKMLNTYVQADEVIQVVEPVNIFEREAFKSEVDKARSRPAPRPTSSPTAPRRRSPRRWRRIRSSIGSSPSLLQQVIDDYRAQRISDAEYLKQVTDVMDPGARRQDPRRPGHPQGAGSFPCACSEP